MDIHSLLFVRANNLYLHYETYLEDNFAIIEDKPWFHIFDYLIKAFFSGTWVIQ